MKRVLLIIFLVIVAPIAGLVLMFGTCAGGLYLATRGVGEPAEALVRLCAAQKFHDAYALGSTQLRARQDETAFTASLKQLGLDRAASASWNQRSIVNSHAKVTGTVRLSDGRELPLTIELDREQGAWKISAIHPPDSATPEPHEGEQQL